MAQEESWELRVSRAKLSETEICPGLNPDDVLAPGQVLLRVESYAMTANNVTYAVMGDLMSYWNFFPTVASWGIVPVWGFAEVVRSHHTNVPEGERFYGYLPSATHLLVEPKAVSERGFTDGSEHRAALPGVYNHYTDVAEDPNHDQA
ncbi:MAG: DUF2855 family protein, partial [Acidimicrobiales bacterium]